VATTAPATPPASHHDTSKPTTAPAAAGHPATATPAAKPSAAAEPCKMTSYIDADGNKRFTPCK